MQNPFADLIPNNGSAQPGLVPLTPPKAPDPFKQRDQELQEEAAARAREDQNFQRQKFALEMDEKKKARTADPKLVESERTAAFLATRLAGGISDLQRYLKTDPDAAKPELGAAVAGIFGSEARNFANSPARRQIEAAQIDILDAALTLGTGAAYTAEQIAGYREAYFPKLTDDEATIREKQTKLRRLLEAAKLKAGSAAPQIDQALSLVGGSEAPAEAPRTEVVGQGDIGFAGAKPPADPLNPDQERAYNAFLKGNPSATPEQLQAFIREMGVGDLSADSARKIVEHYRKTGQFAPGSQAVSDLNADQKAEIARRIAGTDVAGSFAVGAGDTVTLGFLDETAAGVTALTDSLEGKGSFVDRYNRNIGVERGYEEALSKRDPISYTAGQIAGGFVLPTFGASTAAQLARVGGGYGAAYGAGSGEGIADRLIGAGTGAAVGGAGGAALGLIGNHLAARRGGGGGGGRRADAIGLMEAAQRQNVDVLPADVGGPMIRRLTAGFAQTPFGAGPIVRGADRTTDQVADRVGQIAAAEGAPVRQEVLGETARGAAQDYIANSGAEGRQLYESAREGAGEGLFQGRRAFQNLNGQIRELSQTANTEAPLIGGLERLRQDIASDTGLNSLSIDAIRRLRTSVRAEAQSEGLRATDYQRRAQETLADLSLDIAEQLPEAARERFLRADRAWAERLNVIDDVMENVLGPRDQRSAEDVAKRLIAMSRGDSARLRTFVNSVSTEEAGIVRGSLIQEMGRAVDSAQNAAGNQFSLETFLTNWNKLPERARETLFRGESRSAIEDLARVAEGSREARRFANTSNTGGAANVSEKARALSYGAGWMTMGGSFVLENLSGRLLASPRFARFLARPPADPARAARRLASIATREPAIASEILPIQRALETTFGRAAAQQEEDRR